MLTTEKRWPVGKERARVGEISASQALEVNIRFEDIDDVESLEMIVFGDFGETTCKRLPVLEKFELQLTEEERSKAAQMNASLYIISAQLKDGSNRLVSKGRVNCQADTKK